MVRAYHYHPVARFWAEVESLPTDEERSAMVVRHLGKRALKDHQQCFRQEQHPLKSSTSVEHLYLRRKQTHGAPAQSTEQSAPSTT